MCNKDLFGIRRKEMSESENEEFVKKFFKKFYIFIFINKDDS